MFEGHLGQLKRMACLCWFGRRQTDLCCTTYLPCLSNGYMACLCWFGRRQTDRCCTTYLPCLSNGYMACLCWFGRRQTDRCCTTYYTLTVKWIHGLFVLVWQTRDRSVLHYLLYLVCHMQNHQIYMYLINNNNRPIHIYIYI